MSSAPRRTRRDVSRNRQLLIESAREVFAEVGIDAPLDVVAKRSGLGNATLYRHFPTRETLVLETFRLDLRRHDAELTAAEAEGSAWTGLLKWLRFCFRDQLTDVGLTQSLSRVLPGVDDEVDQLRRRTLEAIARLVARARDDGDVAHGVEVGDLLLYLQAHALLIAGGTGPAAAISSRWFDLTVAALEQRPPARSDRGEDVATEA